MTGPLIRNPVIRARLEGVILGLALAMLLVFFLGPIVTGRWELL